MEDFFNDIDKAVEAKFGDQAGEAAPTGQADSAVTKPADQAHSKIEESQGSSDSKAQAIFDLSKAEKFMLNGKEMTLKQLEAERMMQSDYTRKMQEMSKDREYRDNLEADLAKIERDPRLLAEFKSIYPRHYHRAADFAARGRTQEQGEQGTTTQDDLVKQLVEDAVGPIRDELSQYKTDKAVTQLDGIFSEMKTKYTAADEEFVLARLQLLKDQEVPINKAKIEEVFKHFHEKDQKSKEAYHMEQLNKQKLANNKAKDVPSGGGIPGQAPKKFSMNNTKEIEDAMIAHLSR